ncbi:hypothetical protein [Brevundimonas bacteroides]|uniref:hypothetical protein n=1 Tax=Brevundimonas bacteroides TaxID=74311 RepID=UPI0004960222|nr:hypothetical protein [Brevundimonas bacteroides]
MSGDQVGGNEPSLFDIAWAATGRQYGPDALENVRLGWDLAHSAAPAQSYTLTALARDIENARDALEAAETRYLKRWGWNQTCNTPGSYWLWQRDFAAEDKARHAAWAAAGPGPYGMPSEPRPYGVITAGRDLAVSMTLRFLDCRPEDQGGDDD